MERKISKQKWKELEESSHENQRQFLESYEFEEVPVSSKKSNVRPGDDIFYWGPPGLHVYKHHLLVYNVVGNIIYYFDFSGPRGNLKNYSKASSTSNINEMSQLDRDSITYEELENKKAQIRIWPVELQRYDTEKVISRGMFRAAKKEKEYSVIRNNCEHFVNWCKCGLNTSLQVTPIVEVAASFASGFIIPSIFIIIVILILVIIIILIQFEYKTKIPYVKMKMSINSDTLQLKYSPFLNSGKGELMQGKSPLLYFV